MTMLLVPTVWMIKFILCHFLCNFIPKQAFDLVYILLYIFDVTWNTNALERLFYPYILSFEFM